ncbi:MAG: DUF4139 domain-containing protein [Chloroflexi bacterium]|nr:DUF4139 domain-containing protein [Chloroflexota bacterium]
MRRPTVFFLTAGAGLVLASVFGSLSVPVMQAQDATPTAASIDPTAVLLTPATPQPDGVNLTIYNQGTALVQDRRTFDLQAGISTLDFTDVAASIDSTSVSFKSLTDPNGTSVLEQNYVYDLVGSGALLERYLDQQIEIVTNDGTTFSGQLLSGHNGEIILKLESGEVAVVSLSNVRDLRFPALPDGLITRPTLRWLLDSLGGEQQVELTYLTGGINWTADYILLLANDNQALDLNGWVTLTNTSGATFEGAKVKLVAGDVNRIQNEAQMYDMVMQTASMAPSAPPPQVEQREFNEYKLYEIQRPVTVADNETKQVEFVSGTGIPATTFFVYEGGAFYGYYSPITDQYYGQTGITDVQNWLEFTTGEENNLDAALPAGRVRVYQEDVDGSALLIGENSIDHTPKGETVKLYLGNAFDIVGERTQTDFRFISSNIIEERFEIHIRNRKEDESVEVRIPEHLYRWSNWEIFGNSDPFTQMDSATIEFRVTVEPGEEKVVSYTVRYTWPS